VAALSGLGEPAAHDVCVIGSGNWGTTLAILQASSGRSTILCTRDGERARRLRSERENAVSLPGVPFPPSLDINHGYAPAASARTVVVAVPSEHLRPAARALAPYLRRDCSLVSATKGLETDTGLRVSEVLTAELGTLSRLCVLSGPNLAREIAAGLPAAAVLACANRTVAQETVAVLGTKLFRLYTSKDMAGVELGGALKNVVAVAAGICDGLGMGTNGKAAIVTRGMAEIVRLGQACGAEARTFAGLSGYGDLFATCVSPLSRNHFLGEQIGFGHPLAEALAGMTMVAEGVNTARAAMVLAARAGVELPITSQVCAVLFEGREPREAMEALLSRLTRDELADSAE
jgi:glycerol-3-phosphate dehydrogenase (NAD(P)+)